MILPLIVATVMTPGARALPPAGESPIVRGIEATITAVRGTSDEAVYSRGQALQDVLDGGSVRFRPSLHEVQRPQPAGKKTEVNDMLSDAQERLSNSKKLPPSELKANIESQAQLVGERRLGFEASLDDHEMGLYRFLKDRVHDGTVALNYWLRDMGLIMPIEFLEAVAVHEAAHRDNGALAAEGVIDGEVVSFERQYQWLNFVDPTGEKLALLRLALQTQMKRMPNPLTQKALEFAATLDVLVGTGGDRQKIRQFAYELGYRDGEHRRLHGDDQPSGPPSA